MNLLGHVAGVVQNKHTLLTTRSNKWPVVRAQHLSRQPICALCGGNKKLQVHHIKPFHLNPELELSEDNLITLCESELGGVNCHLHYGHLGNYKSYNENVIRDVQEWFHKLQNRPYE